MLSTLRNTTTKNSSRVLKRTLASGKEIKFGVEGRAAMLKGVDMLADAVQVCRTLCRGYVGYVAFFLQASSCLKLTSIHVPIG